MYVFLIGMCVHCVKSLEVKVKVMIALTTMWGIFFSGFSEVKQYFLDLSKSMLWWVTDMGAMHTVEQDISTVF